MIAHDHKIVALLTKIKNFACLGLKYSLLKHRRAELCTKFAIKLFKSSKSKEYFTQVKKVVNTRGDQPIVREYKLGLS